MGLCLGAAALLAGARRRRTAARRVACVAALLWWAVGVGGRAEASVVLQTPPGLNPGDPFRFVFVTEGIRDAISTNIADYDSFVNAQAGGATYSGVLIDWLAIGSTDSVDAIDHVGQATAPVYLSDGTLVTSTTTLSGLWSRTLVHEINLDLAANLVQTFVWTGTNPFGTGFGGPLGALTPQVGSTTDSGGAWIDSGRSNSGDFRPLYGISPVLTVPPAAVPEPSTVTMLGAALSVWPRHQLDPPPAYSAGAEAWGRSFSPRTTARTWRIITFLMLLLLSPGAVAQAPAPCAPAP